MSPKRPKVAAANIGGKGKQPTHQGQEPGRGKQVISRSTFSVPPDGMLRIRFGRLDLGGPWCVTLVDQAQHMELLTAIAQFETMHHLGVFNGHPGKDYDVPQLPTKESRDRLVELGYDDEGQISRLRIGGTGRLYGFRRGQDFWALWWDPEHKIWPSNR